MAIQSTAGLPNLFSGQMAERVASSGASAAEDGAFQEVVSGELEPAAPAAAQEPITAAAADSSKSGQTGAQNETSPSLAWLMFHIGIEAFRAAEASAKAVAAPAESAVAQPAQDSPRFADGETTPSAPYVIIPPPALDKPDWAAEIKPMFAQALASAGIDPSPLRATYWEQVGVFPGAGFVFHQLTVEAPNGGKVDLDASILMKSPSTGVEDIRRLLAAGGAVTS